MMMKRLTSGARPGFLALGIAGLAAIYAGGAAARPASATAAEGRYLYVANQEAAAVTVIDLETHEVVEVIDLEAMGFGANAKPHHIAVEPDGSFWYVSLIAANQVLKFDRENNLVASVEFERPGLLALHPAEPWLFVGRSMAAVNPPQRIGRIDRTSMEVEEYDVFIPRPHALLASRTVTGYTSGVSARTPSSPWRPRAAKRNCCASPARGTCPTCSCSTRSRRTGGRSLRRPR